MKIDLSTLDPSVYLEAAEVLASHEFGFTCSAIKLICSRRAIPYEIYIKAFGRLFKPRGATYATIWWPAYFMARQDEYTREEAVTARIIALHLMAGFVGRNATSKNKTHP